MNYLKPMRRTIGIVTLLAACVLAAGWVRSMIVEDVFTINFSERRIDRVISSMRYGGIMWQTIQLPEHNMKFMPTSWASMKDTDPRTRHWYGADDWKGSSFRFRDGTNKAGIRESLFLASYWSIVIPLTLLSAWLLLSKPGTKNKTSAVPPSENA